MPKQKSLFIFLLIVFFTQACNMQVTADVTATPTTQKIASLTPTRMRPTPTEIIATATKTLLPSVTPAPQVTISAVKGNLFIRRGPDMAYNPIGVLYKNTTTNVVARDVLSKWAQIIIPNSTQTGWVSVLTQYSKVEGNLGTLPEFKITDWPIAGYVRNCTNHQMLLIPGDIYVDSVLRDPENLVWVYPGHYQVYDINMPDPFEVEVAEIDMREGLTIDIGEDGAGDHRKCPKK